MITGHINVSCSHIKFKIFIQNHKKVIVLVMILKLKKNNVPSIINF